MRVPGPFVPTLAAGAVGFFVMWLYVRTTRGETGMPAQAEPSIQQAVMDESLSSSGEPVLERPEARVAVPAVEASPASEADALTANAGDVVDPRTLPEATFEQMRRKRDAIANFLDQRSQPILAQRFENGLFEHVSDGTVWNGNDPEAERTEIYAVRMVPDRGIDRTVLPRDEFPELYDLKDDTLRLDERISAEEMRLAREVAPQ